MKILKENNTHKAVKQYYNKSINIYLKGMDPEAKDNSGDVLFTDEDIAKHPDWFADEYLYSIPAENEEDLLAIFEDLEETTRILVAEANEEITNQNKIEKS